MRVTFESLGDGGTSAALELSAAEAWNQTAADWLRVTRLLVADGLGGPLVVQSRDELPDGYALARQGRAATYVGPVVATTANAAEQLLDGMLPRFAGTE